ncbi:hypothetical protein M9Y10_022799 [Tritrichomonas musculus]|uniref:Uncharacterized protein n=1 Tax=Tritrichomonas musculus TaxID=1915356 RepID=A0ABR2KTF2_9EUKA
MTEIGEAALNFIKAVGEIDLQVTSYRDFSDMGPILSTYYKLFKIEPQGGNEESQTRSMVRFLQKNTTHDTGISIDLEKLILLDYDEIENVACLMFYCMQSDDKKAECEELLSKLDESDREALIGSTKDDTSSKQEEIKKLAKDAHEYSNNVCEINKLNKLIKDLTDQYNGKSENSEMLVLDEENKLRKSHSSSQITLKQIESEINEIESRNSSLINSQNIDSSSNSNSLLVKDEDMDKLQMQHEILTKSIDDLKIKVDKAREKTTEIESFREKKREFDIQTEPLRQKYQSILDQVQEVQQRMGTHEENLKKKNADLIVEVNSLNEKKKEMLNIIDSNVTKLKQEKSEGETAKKMQQITELRKNRDDLKRSINEMKQRVVGLQQALLQGQIEALKLQLT